MERNLIDSINMVSFILGVMNYQQNLTQNDKQEIIEKLNDKLEDILNQIHVHLKEQDRKIDLILKKLTESQD